MLSNLFVFIIFSYSFQSTAILFTIQLFCASLYCRCVLSPFKFVVHGWQICKRNFNMYIFTEILILYLFSPWKHGKKPSNVGFSCKIPQIFNTAGRSKISPNLKFCFIKIARCTTYIKLFWLLAAASRTWTSTLNQFVKMFSISPEQKGASASSMYVLGLVCKYLPAVIQL